MGDFLVPHGVSTTERVIKKSRFIGFIARAESAAAAHEYIKSIRRKYPDARHACWAFVAGEPGNTAAVSCSDDGEPGGTAGRPMLNVLQHSDVGEIVAVVVRYFGGVKLGTGGLARAYSGAVSECLKVLETKEQIALYEFTLALPFALEDATRRCLQNHSATIHKVDYQQQLILTCACPIDVFVELERMLGDIGRGTIMVGDLVADDSVKE